MRESDSRTTNFPEGSLAAQADAALGRSLLKADSARKLLAVLDKVPSLQLQTAIDAILRCSDPQLDQELLEKLPHVPAIKTLAVEKVTASVNGRPDEVKKQMVGDDASCDTTTREHRRGARRLDEAACHLVIQRKDSKCIQ